MDRTLTHFLLACSITACAAGSAEPCAPAPQPVNPHSGDLVDTTEKEAVSSQAPATSSAPAPAPSEAPPAVSGDAAECVIPAKTCGAPESCKSLEELCHTIGDPIAKNDTRGFVKISASDEANADAIAKKGGPRAHFGFATEGPLRVTLNRDCTQCRRSFISYDIQVGDVTIRAMVEGGRITTWSKPK